jgi:hypothetical protein
MNLQEIQGAIEHSSEAYVKYGELEAECATTKFFKFKTVKKYPAVRQDILNI